jgi:hypothetical protein
MLIEPGRFPFPSPVSGEVSAKRAEGVIGFGRVKPPPSRITATPPPRRGREYERR